MATDRDGSIHFAEVVTGNEHFCIGRLVWLPRFGNCAKGHRGRIIICGLLHAPHLELVWQFVAAWVTPISFWRFPFLINRDHLEWLREDFVLRQLALSRIGKAVSEVSGL